MKKYIYSILLPTISLSIATLISGYFPQSDGPSVGSPANSPKALSNANPMAQIRADIRRREYNIRPDAKQALQSPNRQQNLRFRYFPDGFSMETRKDSLHQENWNVRMNLNGIFRGEDLAMAAEAQPVRELEDNHLQFHHASGLTIEYLNNTQGMRQNFILEKKPAGEGLLKAKMQIKSELSATLTGTTTLVFSETSKNNKLQPKVRYTDLKVTDAEGREMTSWMELQNDELALVVDDQDAVYPLTIDPLSTTASAMVEGDQADAWFGYSVGTAGDVNGDGYSDVIVGAYLYDNGQTEEGAAFVYHGSATGISTTAAIMVESNQGYSWFGYSVNTAGDVNGDGYSDVIVGAHSYDNGENNEGAAFVYHGSASGISSIPEDTLDSDQANAYMGFRVSSAGDVNGDGYSDVIVSAHAYTNGEANEGAGFVFHGSAAGVDPTPALIIESNQAGAWMGLGVGAAGDVNGDGYGDVVVGAYKYDNGENDEGAAFVYLGSASGITTPAVDTVESNQTNALLGFDVGTAGDVNGDGYSDVIIGSYYYANGQATEGAALIFHGNATGISNSIDALLESNQVDARLGFSVNTAGDLNGDGYSDVIAGAPMYDNGELEEGAAFVFYGSASGVNTTPAAILEADQADASMGQSVSTAGDVNGDGYSDLIVGAHLYDNGENDEGAAFVYLGGASGISTSYNAAVESNQADAWMGFSVSSAGDVNGDGYADIVVGAPYFDNGEAEEGAAFVYHGTINGINTAPAAMVESNQATAYLGISVASAGDVNADGYSDIIVGANLYDNGEAEEGAAFVYHGSASGISTTAAIVLEGNLADAYFGQGVATAGDINGDGYSDVIVGAYKYDHTETNEGAVFVFRGSASGIQAVATDTMYGNQAHAWFGYSVGGAGDINADGFSDVIVGAPLYDGGVADEGGVFVFYGDVKGINPQSDTLLANQADAIYGFCVNTAGDVNADGYSDIIVGAPNYDNGENDEGAAFVYHGASGGISASPAVVLENDQADAWMGYSVSKAGDVNGDGYGDVIVGALYFDNGEAEEGAAFIYHGSPSGLSGTANAMIESDQADAELGFSVANAGDVNGDGYGDVVVGASKYDNGEAEEGAAFVYHGNLDGNLYRKTRQYLSDLSTAAQNGAPGGSNFGVGHFARSTYGRTKVKLVWEVYSEGNPFSGNPITNSTMYQGVSSSWTDIGTAGTEIKETLGSAGAYNKWRVRVMYNPVTMLDGKPFSRWFYGGINEPIEMSIRGCILTFDIDTLPDITGE
ncbi:MAG: FG-GAP repeat protein, partial [Flavobacteriales bacterium]|nr:FG-GAP repeat protein [Flavobacteriales bacterium]